MLTLRLVVREGDLKRKPQGFRGYKNWILYSEFHQIRPSRGLQSDKERSLKFTLVTVVEVQGSTRADSS